MNDDKPFHADTLDRVLQRIATGADPFTAVEGEGYTFREMMDYIAAHRASGGADHHPSLWLAYAVALDARAAAMLDRLAQRIDAGLVRTPSVAEVERQAIDALLAEARQWRDMGARLALPV